MPGYIVHCKDCLDGEHDDYDDDITICVVTDPDTGKKAFKCAYLCSEHRTMYRDDGFIVNERVLLHTYKG